MICPRCGLERAERFYGPCISCRLKLRQLTAPPPDRENFLRTQSDDGYHDHIYYVGKVTFTGKEDA